ncbi:MAG: MarR family transcriptional regulator [Chloroflexota bacterium]
MNQPDPQEKNAGDLRIAVRNDFIQMTERIANGKSNLRNLGSEEMTFYRGEIHLIKMVGDDPGIFTSEVARHFNVTRAVISKTALKLERRGFLRKEEDATDKRRLRLFLSDKGEQAYRLHDEFHQAADRPLFDYLDRLTVAELRLIETFLKHANSLIENHF